MSHFLIFACSFLLAASVASAIPQVLKEEPRLQQTGLFIYLQQRCQLNIGALESSAHFVSPQRYRYCIKATNQFLKVVDMPGKDHVGHAVVLKTDLVSLLSHPRTSIVLDEIQKRLDLLRFGIQNGTVYETVVKWQGSDAEAVRFIAALFQDTTGDMFQVQYAMSRVEYKSNVTFAKNTDLTYKIIQTLLEPKAASFSKSFYPSFFANSVQKPNIYHFFVIGRLSSLMQAKGFSRAVSFLYPFMLNYGYESISLKNQRLKTYVDNAAFRNPGTLDDVYSGYVGSLWALGRIGAALPSVDFRKVLSHNNASGSNLREIFRKTSL